MKPNCLSFMGQCSEEPFRSPHYQVKLSHYLIKLFFFSPGFECTLLIFIIVLFMHKPEQLSKTCFEGVQSYGPISEEIFKLI